MRMDGWLLIEFYVKISAACIGVHDSSKLRFIKFFRNFVGDSARRNRSMIFFFNQLVGASRSRKIYDSELTGPLAHIDLTRFDN